MIRGRTFAPPSILTIALLLAASLASVGCVKSSAISIPDMPESVEAVYEIETRGARSQLNVTGAYSTDEMSWTLGIEFGGKNPEGELIFGIEWQINHRHYEVVESLIIHCHVLVEAEASCPGPNFEAGTTILPGASGSPGVLWVGPLLGTDIQAGQEVGYRVIDFGRVNEVTARVSDFFQTSRGPCANVEITNPGLSTKPPVLWLQTPRSLTICQGLPLPARLQFNDAEVTLVSANWSGKWMGPAVNPSGEIGEIELCLPELPPSSASGINGLEYAAWAATGDDEFNNDSRYVFPGFSQRYNGSIQRSSDEIAYAFSFYLENDTVHARDARAIAGAENDSVQFLPSERITNRYPSGLKPPEPLVSCGKTGPQWNYLAGIQSVVNKTGLSPLRVDATWMPNYLAPWQGAGAVMFPFWSNEPAVISSYANPLEYNVWVSIIPEGGPGFVPWGNAALDGATGRLDWFTAHPDGFHRSGVS